MKAQAMKSNAHSDELKGRQKDTQPDEETEELETSPEADESELDETDLEDADDDRWEVFILDDDGEPLPEYGDFWFPD
jgi:hypothetical protein